MAVCKRGASTRHTSWGSLGTGHGSKTTSETGAPRPGQARRIDKAIGEREKIVSRSVVAPGERGGGRGAAPDPDPVSSDGKRQDAT
eukprot:357422-Chlamydomonas_euryale.AAC.4